MSFNLTRKFGLELEVICGNEEADPYDVVKDIHRTSGLKVENAVCDYYANVDPEDDRWHAKSDSSVHDPGFELASPPLRGEHGLRELQKMVSVLRDYCSVDNSCGLHVHHEVRDLYPYQMESIWRIYFSFQPVIAFFLPPARRFCSYSPPLDKCLSSMKKFRENYYGEPPARGFEYFPRDSVNLSSISRRGTVEFRQHAGTVDIDKILSWLYFTQGLVEYAKTVRKPKEDREIDLIRMFQRMGWAGKGLDDPRVLWARTYLSSRFEYFTGDKRKAPVVMPNKEVA